jgi:CheY-like chemotaxis protein
MVVMTVTDNGKGIPPELLEKIFEPYFSTKKDKGTGLGLATVNSIVKSYGGMIKIKSEIGKGTSVAVCLPICKEGGATEQKKETVTVQKGKGHILVVDDEDAVRDVLAMSLRHLGYDVDTAASGDEAIKKVCNAEPQFDLVILDMLMPKMSGDETFFRISDIQPGIRVLAVSGYTSEESVQRILRNGGKGFLQKPFTIEELAKNVKAALE